MKRILILALACFLTASCASLERAGHSESLLGAAVDVLRAPPPLEAPPVSDKSIATLTYFSGTVLVMAHGKWGTLPAKGMLLYSSDRVLTQDGAAMVTYNDGTRVGLCKNSHLRIGHEVQEKAPMRTVRTRRQEAMLFLGQMFIDNRQVPTVTHIMTPSFIGSAENSLGNLSINADLENYVFFEEGGVNFFNPVAWSFHIGKFKMGQAEALSDRKADEDPVQQSAIAADAAAVQATDAMEEFGKGLISEAQKDWMNAKAAQMAAEASLTAAKTLYKYHPDPIIVAAARYERDYADQQVQESLKALAKAEAAGAVPPKTGEEKQDKAKEGPKILDKDLEEEIGLTPGAGNAPADDKKEEQKAPAQGEAVKEKQEAPAQSNEVKEGEKAPAQEKTVAPGEKAPASEGVIQENKPLVEEPGQAQDKGHVEEVTPGKE